MSSALLPVMSEPWERVMADAMAPAGEIESAIGAMRRVKHVSPRASMLPFLVWEYGLGELTPYVPNLYQLIDQGVRWRRLRGTASAVAIGLAWIGYSATIEEAWTGRRFWNSFQLHFPVLPAQDAPDLERIEGITSLSVPKRSKLRRGVYRYDLAPLQADYSRLDSAMLDFESGLAVTPKGTIWSFGRSQQFVHQVTQAEGLSIGNWIDPVDGSLPWTDLGIRWRDANFRWSEDPATVRRIVLAGWFRDQVLYVRLKTADGQVIGYRRCRAVHPVRAVTGGAYTIGELTYSPSAQGTSVYAEAMTQFDDASGAVCAEVALMIGAARAAGVKPGRLWLKPHELTGGVAIAPKAVANPLRRTVRDQFKFLLRF